MQDMIEGRVDGKRLKSGNRMGRMDIIRLERKDISTDKEGWV